MIEFPQDPTLGQKFVAENTVTYTWLGDRWNSVRAIEQGTAEFYYEGGRADFVFDANVDTQLDGLNANLQVPSLPYPIIIGSTLNNEAGGYMSYSITAPDVNLPPIECGVIITMPGTPADNAGNLYAYSTEYCNNPDPTDILRITLRQANDEVSIQCGYDINAGPSTDTPITQRIEVSYGLGGNLNNVYVYVKSALGITLSSPLEWDSYQPCLVAGTMITLADGTHKKIEDVTYSDMLKVWSFDLGEDSEAIPVWVKRKQSTNKYTLLTFSDGTELRTVGHHIFNKQAGAFTLIATDETPVGTITVNEHGQEITLVSKETVHAPVDYYNIWTRTHLNAFANGILTGNRYCNIYPIVDMQFVKDDRELRSAEEFAGIDEKYISGLRLQEQTFDLDFIQTMIDRIELLDSVAVVATV